MIVSNKILAPVLIWGVIGFSGCARQPHPRSFTHETIRDYHEEGLASWYGRRFKGRRTASGKRFHPKALTAAHRTLPFGTLVRVTNLANEREVEVTITDRGPFIRKRVIDLSQAAARRLGMLGTGVARVRVEVLSF